MCCPTSPWSHDGSLQPALLLLLIMLLWGGGPTAMVRAQEASQPADELLNQAASRLQQGLYEEALSLLSPRLESDFFSRDQQPEAYRLAATAALRLDHLETGRAYVRAFLRQRPYHVPNPNSDPLRFREELANYRVQPAWTVTACGGLSQGAIAIERYYQPWEAAPEPAPYEASSQPAFALQLRRYLGRRWAVQVGVDVFGRRYRQNQSLRAGRVRYRYQENAFLGSLPLGLVWIPLEVHGWSLQWMGGAFYSQLLRADGVLRLAYDRPNPDANPPTVTTRRTASEDDLTPYRQVANWGWWAGAQLGWRHKRVRYFVEARYAQPWDTYSGQDPYHNLDWSRDFYYAEDVLRIDRMQARVGLEVSLSHTIKNRYQ